MSDDGGDSGNSDPETLEGALCSANSENSGQENCNALYMSAAVDSDQYLRGEGKSKLEAAIIAAVERGEITPEQGREALSSEALFYKHLRAYFDDPEQHDKFVEFLREYGIYESGKADKYGVSDEITEGALAFYLPNKDKVGFPIEYEATLYRMANEIGARESIMGEYAMTHEHLHKYTVQEIFEKYGMANPYIATFIAEIEAYLGSALWMQRRAQTQVDPEASAEYMRLAEWSVKRAEDYRNALREMSHYNTCSAGNTRSDNARTKNTGRIDHHRNSNHSLEDRLAA